MPTALPKVAAVTRRKAAKRALTDARDFAVPPGAAAMIGAAIAARQPAAMTGAEVAARLPVTIDRTVAVGRQDVDYIEHLSIDGRKARITIRSNAYVFQCSAWLDVLDREALKWNRIVALPAAAMRTPAGLCYEQPERKTQSQLESLFAADRAQLLATLAGLMA